MKHLSTLILAFLAGNAFAIGNMIPSESPKQTMNTWCTWEAQWDGVLKLRNDIKKGKNVYKSIAKAPEKLSQRDGIVEETIFGENGWAHNFGDLRSDMYFILDDGWDVDFYEEPWTKDISKFGSHIPHNKRFPSVAGKSPKEKLKWINNKLVALGWRGGAIWIPAQMFPQKKWITPGAQIDFWKERIGWSKYAGIKYWKVDWGIHCHDVKWRKMLTDLAKKEYPDLIIEHAYPIHINGSQCFTNGLEVKDGKAFGGSSIANTPKNQLKDYCEILGFSEIFRTYDTIGKATTLDRMTYELQVGRKNNYNTYITCELNPELAAGLACYFGEMRRPQNPASKHIVAFLRWQRIAPALPINATDVKVSQERLTDIFTHEDIPEYPPFKNVKAPQSAPAIVVRGDLDLPKVSVEKGREKPFVVATLHPNKTLCISFVKRRKNIDSPADAQFNIDCANRKIGVFGTFNTLEFNLKNNSNNTKVWIQDLLTNTPIELKNFEIKDNKLKINFADISLSGDKNSHPAFILFVENK